ncbi:hypothetical protein A0H81_00044 [Grifola frondosa]|uniref:Uncharacterized protein n=1 Tax=Grifola frondosa TaxID=5627 RepID=A0A1C7MPG8_GRIFR|nr:hypothetical protein A0H81_00044 [Grifola frondosa]
MIGMGTHFALWIVAQPGHSDAHTLEYNIRLHLRRRKSGCRQRTQSRTLRRFDERTRAESVVVIGSQNCAREKVPDLAETVNSLAPQRGFTSTH